MALSPQTLFTNFRTWSPLKLFADAMAVKNDLELSSLNTSRLRHFLYMGDEGSRYIPVCMAPKHSFSLERVNSISMLLAENKGVSVVEEIIKVCAEQRTICMNAVLYTLALCATCDDQSTKTKAYNAVSTVCTESEHLFAFVHYIKQIKSPRNGWGRGLRRSISEWYHKQSEERLAIHITKCVSSKGWTHKDLVHLAHMKTEAGALSAAVKFAMKGYSAFDEECKKAESKTSKISNYVKIVHQIKHTTDEHVAARLIESADSVDVSYIPSHLLKSKEVWCSLIRCLPLSITLGQLCRFRQLNFLKNERVMNALLEQLHLDSALQNDPSLNPVSIFVALKKYELFGKTANSPNALHSAMGHNRAVNRHKPNFKLLEALYSLFYSSFKMLKPTGKRFLIAVDVRNPMTHNKVIANASLTPAVCSALLLMNLVRSDNGLVTALAFGSKGLKTLDINNKMMLNDITKRMKETAVGAVNLSDPMQWAQKNKKHVDIFVVCTDTQIYSGDLHPAEALKEYRKAMNLPNAKFVICAMGTSNVSLAPPEEPGMLDLIGFDSNTPRILRDFACDMF